MKDSMKKRKGVISIIQMEKELEKERLGSQRRSQKRPAVL
jgi:hypothetical protein